MGQVVWLGQIVEPDGSVSINNPKAAKALETAKGWVGTISPPGVLAYQEEEARGVWQTGNAAFMRNWPYAYGLGNAQSTFRIVAVVDSLPFDQPPSQDSGIQPCLGSFL